METWRPPFFSFRGPRPELLCDAIILRAAINSGDLDRVQSYHSAAIPPTPGRRQMLSAKAQAAMNRSSRSAVHFGVRTMGVRRGRGRGQSRSEPHGCPPRGRRNARLCSPRRTACCGGPVSEARRLVSSVSTTTGDALAPYRSPSTISGPRGSPAFTASNGNRSEAPRRIVAALDRACSRA